MCCKSKKGDKNREFMEQFEEKAPKPEIKKQKKVEEETIDSSQKNKAPVSPFKGNQYEADF